MSGRKRTDVQLARERAEHLQLQREVRAAADSVTALQGQLREVLARAGAGLRATFKEDVRVAEEWLATVDALPAPRESYADSERAALRAHHAAHAGAAAAGTVALRRIVTAFTDRAPALEREVTRRLSDQEQMLLAHERLLGRWTDAEIQEALHRDAADARSYAERQRYTDATTILDRLGPRAQAAVNEAERFERQHSVRLHTLQALCDVCAAMGYKQVGTPRYERESDLRSRILYKVDTLTAGEILFFLSLDGIETDSGISDRLCYADFDRMSRLLEEQYGVRTRFRPVDGGPDGQLIQRGARDFPEGAAMRAGAT